MADPYAVDSDEEVEDLLGPKEDVNHILNAFQHVGKTIREGGFCSPTKDSSKDVQPTMNDTVVDSSDDSSHERANKSVTFDDNSKLRIFTQHMLFHHIDILTWLKFFLPFYLSLNKYLNDVAVSSKYQHTMLPIESCSQGAID